MLQIETLLSLYSRVWKYLITHSYKLCLASFEYYNLLLWRLSKIWAINGISFCSACLLICLQEARLKEFIIWYWYIKFERLERKKKKTCQFQIIQGQDYYRKFASRHYRFLLRLTDCNGSLVNDFCA
jgi:hypothetical protein